MSLQKKERENTYQVSLVTTGLEIFPLIISLLKSNHDLSDNQILAFRTKNTHIFLTLYEKFEHISSINHFLFSSEKFIKSKKIKLKKSDSSVSALSIS